MAISRPVVRGDYEIVPEGVQQGVMVGNWDIGLQTTSFKDEQGFNKMAYQIVFAWELKIKKPDGNPFLMYKTYTNSLHEKASLRKDLGAWGIKIDETQEKLGFDFDSLVGKNCLITVSHKQSGENIYANMVGISGLPEGMMPISASRQYAIPKWVQDKAMHTPKQQQGSVNPVSQVRKEYKTEEIPF